MTALTEAEALDRAADLIEARGLAHGVYESPTGALCVLGALRMTIFDRALMTSADVSDAERFPLLVRAITRLDRPHVESLVEWNDRNDKAVIVTALRRAADAARADDAQ